MTVFSLESLDFHEHLDEFMKEDAILASMEKNGRVNLITIGWKTIGLLWARPVITVAIHPDRYTYSVLEEGVPEFTVNIGGPGMRSVLNICGMYSGRDVDKVEKTGVELLLGQTTSVPIIKGAHLAYECKIIHTTDSGGITPHKLYFGEIQDCFEQNPIES
ncbi:MAG TPA: flavin reductase family protein [Candidatus Lokiarchaeia archaeon]|nr:flavin reductase family protein [Candidatus Lokiarchaeia archaeon]